VLVSKEGVWDFGETLGNRRIASGFVFLHWGSLSCAEGSVLNPEVKSHNWCFVVVLFVFLCLVFLKTKEKRKIPA